jgi:hypothetical protein
MICVTGGGCVVHKNTARDLLKQLAVLCSQVRAKDHNTPSGIKEAVISVRRSAARTKSYYVGMDICECWLRA